MNYKKVILSLSLLIPISNVILAQDNSDNPCEAYKGCGCGVGGNVQKPKPKPQVKPAQKVDVSDKECDGSVCSSKEKLSDISLLEDKINSFLQSLSEDEMKEWNILKDKINLVYGKVKQDLDDIYSTHASLIEKYLKMFNAKKGHCLLNLALDK